jgi:hypothetical protein
MLSGFLRPRCCVVALWLGVTVGGCVCGKRRPGPPVVYDGAPAVADAERDEPLPRRCGDIEGEWPSSNSGLVLETDPPGALISVTPVPPQVWRSKLGYVGKTPCTLELPRGSYVVRLETLDNEALEAHVIVDDPSRVGKLHALLPELFAPDICFFAELRLWASTVGLGTIATGLTVAGVGTRDLSLVGWAGLGWGLTVLAAHMLWRLHHPAAAEVRQYLIWPAKQEAKHGDDGSDPREP